jgi:tripartite-type tricarboxylate transporter receptor subunit TctC
MLKLLTFVGALLITVSSGMAQEFPKKQPIKIVVAANPGAGTDVMARITAEFLQRRLGQAVVVENRPGASTVIAVDYVSKAAPDGYTLLFTSSDFPLVPAVRENLPYKYDQFTYLIRPFNISTLTVVNPGSPFTTIQDMVAFMKANPGKLRYGSTGVGAVVHLGIAMLESTAGAKGTHIPYTGSAPIFQDMLAGNVEMTQSGLPFPDSLKVLAANGAERHPAFPNVPTLKEAGLEGATWNLWWGFVAPPKLPKAIGDKLTEELAAVYKDPEAIAKFVAATKNTPVPDPLIGEAFKQHSLVENKNWKALVEREKIAVQ